MEAGAGQVGGATQWEGVPAAFGSTEAEDVAETVEDPLGQAEDPKTAPSVLDLLSQHFDGKVRVRVARNSAAPISALHRLAGDRLVPVQMVVAANAATPSADLLPLSRSSEAEVRYRVADNPATPPEVLGSLAEDHCADVRAAVARNPSTPHEVLRRLVAADVPMVTLGVASNPQAPPAVLGELCGHSDPTVAKAARATVAAGAPGWAPAQRAACRDAAVAAGAQVPPGCGPAPVSRTRGRSGGGRR